MNRFLNVFDREFAHKVLVEAQKVFSSMYKLLYICRTYSMKNNSSREEVAQNFPKLSTDLLVVANTLGHLKVTF